MAIMQLANNQNYVKPRVYEEILCVTRVTHIFRMLVFTLHLQPLRDNV